MSVTVIAHPVRTSGDLFLILSRTPVIGKGRKGTTDIVIRDRIAHQFFSVGRFLVPSSKLPPSAPFHVLDILRYLFETQR